MTTTFKPGHHPDADQLSAFIEQALPAHERDGVLAHLAVCSECRGVVSLALPEVPAARPATEPRSWFSGWMVFLPAAAAVAALAMFIFFVHRQGPVLQQQAQATPGSTSPAPVSATPPQVESRPAAPPAVASSAPSAEAAMHASSPLVSQKEMTTSAATGSAGAIQPAPNQSFANESAAGQNVVTKDQAIQSSPAQNAFNSFAPAANDAIASQNQSSNQASAPRSAFHGAAAGGMIQSNGNLQQNDANAQNRLQQSTSQTVQVQAEAQPQVTTESAELSTVVAGRAISNLSFTRQPVPSGLPLLSSAAQGAMVLAIDTHHAVYVSNDSGQHWKTVRAVWKGHAVMVEANSPVKMLATPEMGAHVETYSALSLGASAAKKAGAILSGTVTDPSGAVISGATVTVIDPKTQLARTLTTDASGHYLVAGLDPGSYNLDATAQGFMSNHLGKVAVTASKENLANITLRVGAASETVTVEASDLEDLKTAPKIKTAPVKPAPMDKVRQASAPLFEIVTDKGVHWKSADGINWQPK